MNTTQLKILTLLGVFLAIGACSPLHQAPQQGVGKTDTGSGVDAVLSEPIFKQTLQPVLMNHCSQCHSRQNPSFATGETSADHSLLLNAGLIDLFFPGQSRLVVKVQSGHQNFGNSVAAEIQGAIEDWAIELEAQGGLGNVGSGVALLEATFTSIHSRILLPKCAGCHNPQGVRPKEDYSNYMSTLVTGKIVPGNASESEMFEECAEGGMPLKAPPLSSEELKVLAEWINLGALNN